MPSHPRNPRSQCEFAGYISQDVEAGVYTIRLRTVDQKEVDITSKPPKQDGKKRPYFCTSEMPGAGAAAGAVCRAAYTSRQQLKEHQEAFHGFSLLQCRGCNQKCVDPSNIKKHEATCRGIAGIGEKQYQYLCGFPGCDFAGPNCSNVKRHMRKWCPYIPVGYNQNEGAYKPTRRLKQHVPPAPNSGEDTPLGEDALAHPPPLPPPPTPPPPPPPSPPPPPPLPPPPAAVPHINGNGPVPSPTANNFVAPLLSDPAPGDLDFADYRANEWDTLLAAGAPGSGPVVGGGPPNMAGPFMGATEGRIFDHEFFSFSQHLNSEGSMPYNHGIVHTGIEPNTSAGQTWSQQWTNEAYNNVAQYSPYMNFDTVDWDMLP